MTVFSTFTCLQVVTNPISVVVLLNIIRYLEECSGAPLTTIVGKNLWESMVPQNYFVSNILQNIFFVCKQEQLNLYRFGTAWGWIFDDRIVTFGWTIPLIQLTTNILFEHNIMYMSGQCVYYFLTEGATLSSLLNWTLKYFFSVFPFVYHRLKRRKETGYAEKLKVAMEKGKRLPQNWGHSNGGIKHKK